jgi:NhaA family Na+:H+ antiporter
MAERESIPEQPSNLPKEPIHRVVAPLVRFMHIEAASGLVLLAATIAALAVANSPWGPRYEEFWETPFGLEFGEIDFKLPLVEWINDGLMAIFFFVTGLEVKREIVLGELRELRRAALPIAAALGGMIAPAAVYLALQAGTPAERGWGIPMATDIAFVVGCMALLGPRVPYGLRIMLLTLAIADDLGAILVIAIGYSAGISFAWLAVGLLGVAAVVLLYLLGGRSFPAYTILGIFVWLAFHKSGIHAAIAGVILGLLTPARSYLDTTIFGELLDRAAEIARGDWDAVSHRADEVRKLQWATRETISPLEYLENSLHPWVAFLIMPVFALANAGVHLSPSELGSPVAWAVVLGLVAGKPLGVLLFSWLAVVSGLARLPTGVNWPMLAGGACLCGIGFTMALFIAGLALEDGLLASAKFGVLLGSLCSALAGGAILVFIRPEGRS